MFVFFDFSNALVPSFGRLGPNLYCRQNSFYREYKYLWFFGRSQSFSKIQIKQKLVKNTLFSKLSETFQCVCFLKCTIIQKSYFSEIEKKFTVGLKNNRIEVFSSNFPIRWLDYFGIYLICMFIYRWTHD